MELINNKYITGAMDSLQGGRMENQDDLGYMNTPYGFLVVVCDGMGGGPGGKLASYIAKSAIGEYIDKYTGTEDRKTIVKSAIEEANTNIRKQVERNPSLRGMGTTAVVLLMNDESAIIGHVGDSRLYKLRSGQIVFKTRDHSVVGDMVRKKILTEEQARLSSQSNILTRSIGVSDTVDVEIDEIAYEKGDRIVICTDGLWGANSEKTLVKALSERNNIPVIVEKLMENTDAKGIANGGKHDNLTLVLLKTKCNSKKKETMSRKAKNIIALLALLATVSLLANIYFAGSIQTISELKTQNKQLSDSITEKNSDIKIYKSKLADAEKMAKISKDASEANKKVSDMVSKNLGDSLKKTKNHVTQLQKELSELKQKEKDSAKANEKDAIRKKNISEAKRAMEQMLTLIKNKTTSNQTSFNNQKQKASNAVLLLSMPKLSEKIKKLDYKKSNRNTIQSLINQLPKS